MKKPPATPRPLRAIKGRDFSIRSRIADMFLGDLCGTFTGARKKFCGDHLGLRAEFWSRELALVKPTVDSLGLDEDLLSSFRPIVSKYSCQQAWRGIRLSPLQFLSRLILSNPVSSLQHLTFSLQQQGLLSNSSSGSTQQSPLHDCRLAPLLEHSPHLQPGLRRRCLRRRKKRRRRCCWDGLAIA